MAFKDIDGIRVAYEDTGTGPPIVLIPGLVGTREWYKYQSSGLGESYRIISYDVRSARNPAAYTLDLLVEDLEKFLSTFKIEFATIVGHCFGAMIAQRFAMTHPDRTDALILISGFPSLPEQTNEELIEAVSPGPPRVQSAFARLLSGILPKKRKPVQDEEDGLAWLASHSAVLTKNTLNARLRLMREFDSTEQLVDIQVPTQVIVGAKDSPQFLSGAQLLYEGIPDSELEVIEDGDHWPFYSRFDLVNEVIDEFLTDRLTRL